MSKQTGVTLTGLIFVLALLAMVALLGFKLVPVLLEYQTVKKQFRSIAEDPAMRNASRPAVERAFINRAMVDNIQNVKPEDLEVTKDGGELVLSADYSVKVPLFANVAACLDFHPSSK
jgi:Tfp pilus assembly protein FimT